MTKIHFKQSLESILEKMPEKTSGVLVGLSLVSINMNHLLNEIKNKEFYIGFITFPLIAGALTYNLIKTAKKNKSHKELSEKYQEIFDHSKNSLVIHKAKCDKNNLIEVNKKMIELSEYSKNELLNMNIKKLLPCDTHCLKKINEDSVSYESTLQTKSNKKIPVEISNHFINKENGTIQVIIRDITKRKEIEQQLINQTYIDELTGIHNRKAFNERLEDTINNADRYNFTKALLFIDIDNFKTINDNYGHNIGDKVLKEISSRLKDTIRTTDYVFRLGGDEFTVILNNPIKSNPKIISERIITNIKKEYKIDEISIDYLSASIGISYYPRDGNSSHELLNNADKAMYQIKNSHKDGFIDFSELNSSSK